MLDVVRSREITEVYHHAPSWPCCCICRSYCICTDGSPRTTDVCKAQSHPDYEYPKMLHLYYNCRSITVPTHFGSGSSRWNLSAACVGSEALLTKVVPASSPACVCEQADFSTPQSRAHTSTGSENSTILALSNKLCCNHDGVGMVSLPWRDLYVIVVILRIFDYQTMKCTVQHYQIRFTEHT